jgi:hypothetical protein
LARAGDVLLSRNVWTGGCSRALKSSRKSTDRCSAKLPGLAIWERFGASWSVLKMDVSVTATKWGFLSRVATTAAPEGMFVEHTPALRHDAVQITLLETHSPAMCQHVVVNTADKTYSEQDRDALQRLLHETRPGYLISFLLDCAEGQSRVAVTSEQRLHEVACAHAICQYSGSWDESQPITVSLADRKIRVVHEFDGREWRCRTDEGVLPRQL